MKAQKFSLCAAGPDDKYDTPCPNPLSTGSQGYMHPLFPQSYSLMELFSDYLDWSAEINGVSLKSQKKAINSNSQTKQKVKVLIKRIRYNCKGKMSKDKKKVITSQIIEVLCKIALKGPIQ